MAVIVCCADGQSGCREHGLALAARKRKWDDRQHHRAIVEGHAAGGRTAARTIDRHHRRESHHLARSRRIGRRGEHDLGCVRSDHHALRAVTDRVVIIRAGEESGHDIGSGVDRCGGRTVIAQSRQIRQVFAVGSGDHEGCGVGTAVVSSAGAVDHQRWCSPGHGQAPVATLAGSKLASPA